MAEVLGVERAGSKDELAARVVAFLAEPSEGTKATVRGAGKRKATTKGTQGKRRFDAAQHSTTTAGTILTHRILVPSCRGVGRRQEGEERQEGQEGRAEARAVVLHGLLQ